MDFDYQSPLWHMWELINPSPKFNNVKESFRAYWNSLTTDRQRQIYWYIREQKRRGVQLKPNPLYVLQDCDPQPTNYNQHELDKGTHYVIAEYKGAFGVYPSGVARLFNMKIKSQIINN